MFVDKEIVVRLDVAEVAFLLDLLAGFRQAEYLLYGTEELVCMALFDKWEGGLRKKKEMKLKLKPFQASALEHCILHFCHAVEPDVRYAYMWAVGMIVVGKLQVNMPYLLWITAVEQQKTMYLCEKINCF